MSKLFPEVVPEIQGVPKTNLFPELTGKLDAPMIPPSNVDLPPPTVESTPQPVPGVPPPPDPSQLAYKAGLEAFLGGNEDAALEAWGKSGLPEAQMGIQRIMKKRTPTKPVNEESLKSYQAGLIAFMDGNHDAARQAWTMALQADPMNLAARNGLKRLSQ